MSAEKVIHTLLLASTAVTSIVGSNVYPGELPQGTPLPALGISHMSSIEQTAIDASAAYMLVQTRVEVTVLAKDYVTQKTLRKAVRAACNYAHGVIGGVTVAHVVRESEGPDMRDSDLNVFSQNIDFMVTWQEPNP